MTDADDFEQAVQRIERMAERLQAAAQVFKDARLILGGSPAPQPPETGNRTAAPDPRPPTRALSGFDGFTAQEMAERQRLNRQNRGDDLPDAIKALEAQQ
jgi:hypothetical protein